MWTAEQFWSNVDVREPHECWPWTAGVSTQGYGKLMWGAQVNDAHVIAYVLSKERTNIDQCILHSLECTTRLCCNPDHLREGTKADNSRDMAIKRSHPLKKLTDAQVLEARALRRDEGISYNKLAARYGVTRGAIETAVKGKTFKYLGGGDQ